MMCSIRYHSGERELLLFALSMYYLCGCARGRCQRRMEDRGNTIRCRSFLFVVVLFCSYGVPVDFFSRGDKLDGFAEREKKLFRAVVKLRGMTPSKGMNNNNMPHG